MAKKRRHVAQRATNREIPVDNEAIKRSLEKLGTYYSQLSADVAEIPADLERTLLLHSVVALVVQHALLVVETVSTAQIVLVVGTALWMARKPFVAMLHPPVVLRDGGSREVFWRSVIAILMSVGLGVAFYWWEFPLSSPQLVAFVVVVLLDITSIYLTRRSKGRLIRRQIVLSAVEVTTLVLGFSLCFHYKKGIIYDEMAFVLTGATAFVHVVALLTAEYVVLQCFSSDNGAFSKTRQRGEKLMEGIWKDIDRFEPDQMLVGSSKKKSKSKSRASAKATGRNNGNSFDPATYSRSAVLNQPQVQLALLTLVQMLLLLSQLFLSAFVLYSWEMTSALMFSSSHVLWIFGHVRRKVVSCSTFKAANQQFKNE